MAIQKSECPAGGNHTWVAVNPGTWKCSKCPATRKTGSKSNQTKQGAVTISALLLILVVIIGGYYLVKPVIAAEQSQTSDPVAMLKAHLNRLQMSCANGEVIRCRNNNAGKTEVHTGTPLRNLRYDVQRTSSLISPYLAQVSFRQTSGEGFLDFDITVGWQDGKWVLTDLQFRHYSGYGFIDCNEPMFKESCRSSREMSAYEFSQRMGVQ